MDEEAQQQQPATKQQSALDILLNLDKQAADLKAQHKNNASHENEVCANWARSEIQSARSSALATKSIFTHCFIAPWSAASPFRCVYAVLMLFLAIVSQVVVPFIILITRQPILDLPNGCPNQSSPQTKIIGFALSLYFVFQTLQLCLNKLRGLGFLHTFVDLGFGRSVFIKLGVLSQFLGMAGAGGAQYMLFIGNADGAFIVLVLQSLAMTFCLTVDQNLMGHKNGTYTAARVSAVSKDHLLCNGVGIGEDGGSLPKQSFDGIKQMILGENFILAMISSTGLAWVVALTYCM
mmetsp:Transcript_17279/g.28271  ORF Transcript_17279/g.28271 Transcript_17279/m.28271 type:complete len:293 (+) Transcript_17279:64-942(+)